MIWLQLLIWSSTILVLVAAVSSAISWRKTRRNIARIQQLWATEAPPVEPVVVVLKTGDKVSVQPEVVHRAWVWEVNIPAPPDQVEEILFPTMPPWTDIVPLPPAPPRTRT